MKYAQYTCVSNPIISDYLDCFIGSRLFYYMSRNWCNGLIQHQWLPETCCYTSCHKDDTICPKNNCQGSKCSCLFGLDLTTYSETIHYHIYIHVTVYMILMLMLMLEVVGSSPIKGPRCFLEQEMLALLISTGCFQ